MSDKSQNAFEEWCSKSLAPSEYDVVEYCKRPWQASRQQVIDEMDGMAEEVAGAIYNQEYRHPIPEYISKISVSLSHQAAKAAISAIKQKMGGVEAVNSHSSATSPKGDNLAPPASGTNTQVCMRSSDECIQNAALAEAEKALKILADGGFVDQATGYKVFETASQMRHRAQLSLMAIKSLKDNGEPPLKAIKVTPSQKMGDVDFSKLRPHEVIVIEQQECSEGGVMQSDIDTVIEAGLIAFLKEKSAQMGEQWYQDQWQEYKTDNPESFSEEMAQMRCAYRAMFEKGRNNAG